MQSLAQLNKLYVEWKKKISFLSVLNAEKVEWFFTISAKEVYISYRSDLVEIGQGGQAREKIAIVQSRTYLSQLASSGYLKVEIFTLQPIRWILCRGSIINEKHESVHTGVFLVISPSIWRPSHSYVLRFPWCTKLDFQSRREKRCITQASSIKAARDPPLQLDITFSTNSPMTYLVQDYRSQMVNS